MISSVKILSTIKREDLVNLYEIDKLTETEIANKYKLKSNTGIHNLLIKFDIPIRSRKEVGNILSERKISTIDITKLSKDTETMSKVELSEKYGISLTILNKILNKHDLVIKNGRNFETEYALTDKLKLPENEELTVGELCIKYDIHYSLIKKRKIKTCKDRKYTNEEIKDRIKLYKFDLNNQGLVKIIQSLDYGLYTSILNNTSNHVLQSEKFTERLYRIINDIEYDITCNCTYCGEYLKFTTILNGYGNSVLKICKICISEHCGLGVSKISQELFDIIYLKLDDKSNCFYHSLNKEYIIIKGKSYIRVDFKYKNKIIEFDGEYWHKETKEKDDINTNYLISKGYDVLRIKEKDYYKNKQEVIEKCMRFLNEEKEKQI